MQNE
jgi:hypothetical protein